MSEKFIPAELPEIKLSSGEAKTKIAMMVEQEIPLLENLLMQIRFNTGYQAGYRLTERGDIVFFVSKAVDLKEFQETVADLQRLRADLSKRLKILLRQGAHLKGYYYASERELNKLQETYVTF